MGQVTLRQALAHSLNVAAVKVAQMAGIRTWWRSRSERA